MSNLEKMANPKIYYSGAMVIGLFGCIDAVMMLMGKGNPFNQSFSVIEVCWFLVSFYFFLAFKAQGSSFVLPLTYVGYAFYGLVFGSIFLLTSPTGELSLPSWYMLTALLFNMVYFGLSFWIYYGKYRY